jgi:hypothetical protein
MARHVIMFQPRFAPLVESGAKLQTIRPWRKRQIKAGDIVDLRTWSGLPYRSKQRKLCEAMVAMVLPVSIYIQIEPGRYETRALRLGYGGAEMDEATLSRFSHADGFTSTADFFGFFERTYGKKNSRGGVALHFHGQVIIWQPNDQDQTAPNKT